MIFLTILDINPQHNSMEFTWSHLKGIVQAKEILIYCMLMGRIFSVLDNLRVGRFIFVHFNKHCSGQL
jgi:hypothetical protein